MGTYTKRNILQRPKLIFDIIIRIKIVFKSKEIDQNEIRHKIKGSN